MIYASCSISGKVSGVTEMGLTPPASMGPRDTRKASLIPATPVRER